MQILSNVQHSGERVECKPDMGINLCISISSYSWPINLPTFQHYISATEQFLRATTAS